MRAARNHREITSDGELVAGAALALSAAIMSYLLPKTHEPTFGHELRDAIVICLLATAALTSACHHDQDARGPAEKAGAAVDHAAEKTKDTVKGGVEGVKNGAKKDDDK
ncbi:MAG: hypothetical protein ABI421_12710 [Polyangiaceae bacterium]